MIKQGLSTKWIQKILDVHFKGRDFIKQQLETADKTIEETPFTVNLMFTVDKSKGKAPTPVRVPVEMHALQPGGAPVVFLLHVVNGYVNELEIYKADLSQLNADNISLDNVEYLLDDSVALDQNAYNT